MSMRFLIIILMIFDIISISNLIIPVIAITDNSYLYNISNNNGNNYYNNRNLRNQIILLEYPTIIMIGAMKAGTTSFHKLMVDKSQGKICDSGEKEKHFFNSKDYAIHYKEHVAYFKNEFKNCKPEQLTMDSTPGYSVNDMTVGRIQESYSPEDLSKKKFMLLLREPVARHYSEYQMMVINIIITIIIIIIIIIIVIVIIIIKVRNCLDQNGFLEIEGEVNNKGILRLEKWVNACNGVAVNTKWIKGRDINKDHTPPEIMTFGQWTRALQGKEELRRGRYLELIKRYLKIIRRDQLFIINFRSIIYNTTDTLTRTYKYLGLSVNVTDVKLPTIAAQQQHPNTLLDCKTVDQLTKYFNIQNDGLNEILQSSKKNQYEPDFGEWDNTRSKCIGESKVNMNIAQDDDFLNMFDD